MRKLCGSAVCVSIIAVQQNQPSSTSLTQDSKAKKQKVKNVTTILTRPPLLKFSIVLFLVAWEPYCVYFYCVERSKMNVNHNLNTLLKLCEELKHKLLHELDGMKMDL